MTTSKTETKFDFRDALRLARFWHEEEGVLTIFGLAIFLMMMVTAGVALDVIRSERERTDLQYAIDRATLAAAGLDQTRDGAEIVADYMRASGIAEESVTTTATHANGARRVSVEGTAVTQSYFLNLLGHDEVVQPVSSEALEEEIELEVSLVVDVSGSMGWAAGDPTYADKISNLRVAAADFVREALNSNQNRTTISVIPYNEMVNAGSTIDTYFTLSNDQVLSRCTVFSDAEYQVVPLPSTIQRRSHFDRQQVTWSNSPGPITTGTDLCPSDDTNAILPFSSNPNTLQTMISGLGAQGSTSINIGAKWGAALLDPSVRPQFDSMIDDGLIPEIFRGRPFDYNTDGVNKVLIVMTDGMNNHQRDLKQSRRGPSGVHVFRARKSNGALDPAERYQWDDTKNGTIDVVYSFYDPDYNDYYVIRPDENYSGCQTRVYLNQPYGGSNAVELTWEDLYATMPMRYISEKLLRPQCGSNDADWSQRRYYRDGWETTHSGNDRIRADGNLSDICAAARGNGILVYAIAFEAPPEGERAMLDCAGQTRRYFDVTGLDLSTAFDDILASISKLRLTR